MREIKCRAWDKKKEVMMHPEYMWWENKDFADQEFTLKEISLWETPDSYEKPGNLFKAEDVELMQYTGLKDKNGKEIYSGDICRMHRFTEVLGENLGVMEGEVETVVQMSIGVMGVMVNKEPLFAYFDEDFHDMSEPFEIIGNIHQNPELLEQS